MNLNETYYKSILKQNYSFDDEWKPLITFNSGIATGIYVVKNLWDNRGNKIADEAVLKICDPLKKLIDEKNISLEYLSSQDRKDIEEYIASFNNRYTHSKKIIDSIYDDDKWPETFPIVEHYRFAYIYNDSESGGYNKGLYHPIWYSFCKKLDSPLCDYKFTCEEEIKKFAYKFAEAINKLHSFNITNNKKGLSHCDIKESNIFYNGENVTFIDVDTLRESGDISYSIESDILSWNKIKNNTLIFNSHRSSAPEIGYFGKSFQRSDIYSFSVVILDLILKLNGIEINTSRLLYSIEKNGPVEDWDEINRCCQYIKDKTFREIIKRCLSVKISKRLSAPWLLSSINNLLNHDIVDIEKAAKKSYEEISENYQILHHNSSRSTYKKIDNNLAENSQNVITIAENKHLLANGYLVDDNDILQLYFGDEEYITLPNEIKGVGIRAFAYSPIKRIVLNTQLYLDYESFLKCKNLIDVKLSKSLKDIKGRAFLSCDNLEKIFISEATIVEKDAFLYCKNLKMFIDESGVEIDPLKLNFVSRIYQKKDLSLSKSYLELVDVDINHREIISNLLTIDNTVTNDEEFLLTIVKLDVQRIESLVKASADPKLIDRVLGHLSALLVDDSNKYKSWFARQFISYVKCLYWTYRANNCLAGGTATMYFDVNYNGFKNDEIRQCTIFDFLQYSEKEYLNFLECFQIPKLESRRFDKISCLDRDNNYLKSDLYFYTYIPKGNSKFVKRLYSEIGNIYYNLSKCNFVSDFDKRRYSELAFSYLDESLDLLENSWEDSEILGRYGKLLEKMFEICEDGLNKKTFRKIVSIYKKAEFNYRALSGLHNVETSMFLMNCYLRRIHDILNENSQIKIMFDENIYKKNISFFEYDDFWKNNLNSENIQEIKEIFYEFIHDEFSYKNSDVFGLWRLLLGIKLGIDDSEYRRFEDVNKILDENKENGISDFFSKLFGDEYLDKERQRGLNYLSNLIESISLQVEEESEKK